MDRMGGSNLKEKARQGTFETKGEGYLGKEMCKKKKGSPWGNGWRRGGNGF